MTNCTWDFLTLGTDKAVDAIREAAVKAWRPAFAQIFTVMITGIARGEIGTNTTRMLLSPYKIEPLHTNDFITSTQHTWFNVTSYWNVGVAGKVRRDAASGTRPLNIYEHTNTREHPTIVGEPGTNALPTSVSYWTIGHMGHPVDLSKYRYKHTLGYISPSPTGKASLPLQLYYDPGKKAFLTVTTTFQVHAAKKHGYMVDGKLMLPGPMKPMGFFSENIGYRYPKAVDMNGFSTLSVWVKRSELGTH